MCEGFKQSRHITFDGVETIFDISSASIPESLAEFEQSRIPSWHITTRDSLPYSRFDAHQRNSNRTTPLWGLNQAAFSWSNKISAAVTKRGCTCDLNLQRLIIYQTRAWCDTIDFELCTTDNVALHAAEDRLADFDTADTTHSSRLVWAQQQKLRISQICTECATH